MPDTPLGNIVRIRSEDDKEVLKTFTKSQLKIRSEWRNKQSKTVDKQDMKKVLEQLKNAFITMAKGGG